MAIAGMEKHREICKEKRDDGIKKRTMVVV